MSIPVIASYAKANGLASTTLTCNKPSGVASGDLLLLICANDKNGSTAQFSDNLTGWNFLGDVGNSTSDTHAGAFWRIADGTEGSSVSVTSEGTYDWVMFYIRITGADTTSPIDNSYFSQTPIGSASSCTFDSFSTNDDDCLVIGASGFDGADGYTFSVQSGSTNWSLIDEEQTSNGGSGESGFYCSLDQASAGSVQSLGVDSSVSDGWAPFMISILGAAAGGVTVTPSAISCIAGKVDPTFVAGSLSLSPSAISCIVGKVDPTVVLTYDLVDDLILEWETPTGVSVTPSPVSCIAGKVDPTFIAGSLTIAPSPANCIAGKVDPTFIAGSLTIEPTEIYSIALSIDPTVVLGSSDVSPPEIYAITSGVDPTVQIAGVGSIEPDPVYTIASGVDPTVVLGDTTASPSSVSTIASGVDPSIIYGSIIITPSPADSKLVALDPYPINPQLGYAIVDSLIEEVIQGSLWFDFSGTPNTVVTSGIDPTVLIEGNVTAEPAPASAVVDKVNPFVDISSLIVAPAPASCIAGKVDPVVVYGSLLLQPSFIYAIAGGVDPTVLFDNVVVSPAFSYCITGKADPVVGYGSTIASPPACSTIPDTIDPTVIYGNLSITPSPASCIAGGVDPTIINVVVVTPSPVSCITSGVDPTVDIGNIFVTPSPASCITGKVDPGVMYGNLFVTPAAPADVITSGIDPSVYEGALIIAPSPASCIASGIDPGIIEGSLIIQPLELFNLALNVAPEIDTGPITINGTHTQFENNGYISVADDDLLSFWENQFSFTAWIRFDTTNQYQQIVSKGQEYEFRTDFDGRLQLYLYDSNSNGSKLKTSQAIVPVGVWKFVSFVCRVDIGGFDWIEIYMDGTQYPVYSTGGANFTQMRNGTGELRLGRGSYGTHANQYLTGGMYEAILWNEDLGKDEVASVHAGERWGDPPNIYDQNALWELKLDLLDTCQQGFGLDGINQGVYFPWKRNTITSGVDPSVIIDTPVSPASPADAVVSGIDPGVILGSLIITPYTADAVARGINPSIITLVSAIIEVELYPLISTGITFKNLVTTATEYIRLIDQDFNAERFIQTTLNKVDNIKTEFNFKEEDK